MSDKAAFVSTVLYVQRTYRGNSYFTAPKAAPIVAKNIVAFHFHSDQHKKTSKWAGNMLMFHVDIKMKRLGIVKTTLYTVYFQIKNFAGCLEAL